MLGSIQEGSKNLNKAMSQALVLAVVALDGGTQACGQEADGHVTQSSCSTLNTLGLHSHRSKCRLKTYSVLAAGNSRISKANPVHSSLLGLCNKAPQPGGLHNKDAFIPPWFWS